MKKKGFTLIELLIVIAIIGLLATLGIVSMSSARAKARDAKRISDLTQIRSAMELYFNDNGEYVVGGCESDEALTTDCDEMPYIDWGEFTDPRASKESDAGACLVNTPPESGDWTDVEVPNTKSCHYAFTEKPGAVDYEVCAWLEQENDKFPQGTDTGYYISVNPDGFTLGCPGTGSDGKDS